MSTVDVTALFAATFVDELAHAGVRHAVVAPGSRNTPLVLALARHADIVVDVVLDERSAAFRALGIGMATSHPAVVCCTSGTAVANLHPAVLESHHARIPLLVCTADRPPELLDCGAPQTVAQPGLFGAAVRWFHDPGPPAEAPDAPRQWSALAARAVDASLAPVPGPVHLNLPFREPLVPSGEPFVAERPRSKITRAALRPAELTASEIDRVAAIVRSNPRGLVVAGFGARADATTVARFADAAGWPLLPDAVSNARVGTRAISTYEALSRVEPFTRTHVPDIVLRIGAPLTSKATNAWLADVPTILVDPDHRWLDPARATVEHIAADADAALAALADVLGSGAASEWNDEWRAAEQRVRRTIDRVLDAGPDCEARIARDLADAIPDGGALVVSSSVPVRALEWSMRPRAGLDVFANRGVNGIDGFVSTVGGVAAGRSALGSEPVVGLTGDLGFLHDVNGLAALADEQNATLVVLDNNGGAIFSYLPPRDLPEFERLFTTPHNLDLVAVARAHGVETEQVSAPRDWVELLKGGPRVVVVPLDAAEAWSQHQAMWDAVAADFPA